jgi:hypothetical protein
MSNEIEVRKWIKLFDQGEFDQKDVDTMIRAGWYDWFCTDTSLHTRMKKMVPAVRALVESAYFDQKLPQYVFFKNNCPVRGELYDAFSICSIADGQVQWWVSAKVGHDTNNTAQVCHRPRGFSSSVLEEYARLLWGHSPAMHRYLNGGVRTLKRFFSYHDMQAKKQILGIE